MTSVEWLDEQIQERVIAQDVVARKMIIEISMEDYMNIKRQAKEMEKQQIIDALTYGNKMELMASQKMFAEQYYTSTYGSKGSDELSKVEENTNFDTSTKIEISDEEIEESSKYIQTTNPDLWTFKIAWKAGAKWYREQLKKKQ